MHTKMEKTNRDVADHCDLCGRVAELFEFHGRPDKCCADCCADLTIAVLLTKEIDAATMAGQDSNGMACEFAEAGGRILQRAQSADFGLR